MYTLLNILKYSLTLGKKSLGNIHISVLFNDVILEKKMLATYLETSTDPNKIRKAL